jgi:hypothetical protein
MLFHLSRKGYFHKCCLITNKNHIFSIYTTNAAVLSSVKAYIKMKYVEYKIMKALFLFLLKKTNEEARKVRRAG